MIAVSPDDLRAILPEILLLLFASALLLARPARATATMLSLSGVIVAALALSGSSANTAFFLGAYETGPAIGYLKALALVAAALGVLLLHADRKVTDHHPEIVSLALMTVTGVLLLISARHLAVAYLAFELISVPSYALVGSMRGDSRSAEGGLKYAVFGGAASGLLLYGMSLLYGTSGSLAYQNIGAVLLDAPLGPLKTPLALTGAVLVAAGVFYKLAAAPFHYWCPDAFEAAPPSIGGFLSIAPKIGGFGLLLALSIIFAGNTAWAPLLATAAVFSMLLGNLAAIPQTNVRRLLAYSSIAHGGYLLVGAVAQTPAGNFSILFYLTVYLFMNLGAFFVSGIIGPTIDDFRGLGRRSPFTAFCMSVFLFSLTGLPPFGGFIGKLFILTAALNKGMYLLITALIFASVVSLFVYARILKVMYFEDTKDGAAPAIGPLEETVLAVMTAAVLLLGLWWEPVGRLVILAVAPNL